MINGFSFLQLTPGTYRRVREDLDMFIHKDEEGVCYFRIELPLTVRFHIKKLDLTGLEVLSEKLGSKNRFSLKLKNTDDLEVFEDLCQNLADVKKQTDLQRYANALTGQLLRWVNFLRGVRKTEFDLKKQLGLLGELSFMENLHAHNLTFTEILTAWRGPDGTPKDFMLDNCNAEVKAHFADKRTITISDVEQLDTGTEKTPLFLVVYSFIEKSDGENLEEKIQNMLAAISGENVSLGAVFENKLLSESYDTTLKYTNLISVRYDSMTFYAVENGFPRIVYQNLPSGIARVKYDLNLTACSDFIRGYPIELDMVK